MVIPLAFSSGALSISSTFSSFFAKPFINRTCVKAAVKVVLPWSTCPMVPTFTCGLVLTNFSFSAINLFYLIFFDYFYYLMYLMIKKYASFVTYSLYPKGRNVVKYPLLVDKVWRGKCLSFSL